MNSNAYQGLFAADKLAGLIFPTQEGWCYFRTDGGFTFNCPLDKEKSYALVDPETHECIGIRSPRRFVGTKVPPVFRVYLLHPLMEDVEPT